MAVLGPGVQVVCVGDALVLTLRRADAPPDLMEEVGREVPAVALRVHSLASVVEPLWWPDGTLRDDVDERRLAVPVVLLVVAVDLIGNREVRASLLESLAAVEL